MTTVVVAGEGGLAQRLTPAVRVLGAVTVVAVLLALGVALVVSPAERVMGQGIRILYVHAGAAWTAYLSYVVTAIGALMVLWRRQVAWDWLALASAELGVVLTSVTLLTGMLWGRVAQGWWWRWEDPRLTLTLLLWFLYVGYLILRHATTGERRIVLSAVLAVVGIPAMILNHFAVTLFRTFHPEPVVVRPGGPALDAPFGQAILLSVIAYTLLYVTLLLARIRLEARREQAVDSSPPG
jgi:heme exporter protein C